jgi:hypothetical protein
MLRTSTAVVFAPDIVVAALAKPYLKGRTQLNI